MKSALLLFLLIPSTAVAGVVARVAVLPGAVVAPILLQSPVLPGSPSLLSLTAPALTPSLQLSAPALIAPTAPALAQALVPAVQIALTPAVVRAQALQGARALAASVPFEGPSEQDPARMPIDRQDPTNASGWTDGGRLFDGANTNNSSVKLVDTNFGPYRRLNRSEQNKLNATVRYGADGSPVFGALNSEFERLGGYYLIDSDRNARYMSAAAVDSNRRPVILLTYDLLNRYNGRSGDAYRGAPWEFIASLIAREQVFYNAWYSAIPASAEKLAISFMNMTHVFVDLTNGTSRSWATDKDYQAVSGDRSTYTQWNWFEVLVTAARDAARGVGTNSGHIIDSKFFSWIRDWTAPQEKATLPAFQYSLWEQLDGRYYRPGDAKNGQPLPPGAPRINQATYDRAAQTAYGADGKGSDTHGTLDPQTAYGWIIQWLKGRFEI